MASESPPPDSVDTKPPNPAAEPVQNAVNEPQATSEPPKDISSNSVFVNSQPIREDQVQNAIKFLSHPRVKGSPVVHRRNFLERKGLTKEEIDEAFRRVPDPPSTTANGQTSTSQDAQASPATNIQAQAPMQPVTAVQPGVMSTMARRYHWSHALLAVGFLAISGAGTAILFKKYFAEFMTLLNAQLQEIKTMRNAILKLEGQPYIAGKNHVREEYLDGSIARSVIMAMVQRGERPPNVRILELTSCWLFFCRRTNLQDIDDRPPNPNQPITNPSLAPRAKPWEVGQPTSNSSFAPQYQATPASASYSTQDNGVTYQFNNGNSVPWQQQTKARITEFENGDGQKFGSGSNGTANIGPSPTQRRWVPPQPPPVSMAEAAAAIRQPKSAPKDVNLNAEETVQPVNGLDELQRITQLSESGGQPELNGAGNSEIISGEIQEEQVTEPWEVGQPATSSIFAPQSQVTAGGTSYSVQDTGVTCQLNNDISVPWQQQTKARTTEVENGGNQKFGSGSNGSTNIGPTQRKWVPPQPPSVSMAEAAVAIRQPKSSPKDANLNNEAVQLLQRIQISESVGQPELNGGGSSEMISSEIQEDQVTEIMAMVQRGGRPPNVRDIDDRPPNPNQPISKPNLAPRAKPWEVGQPANSSIFAPQSLVTAGGASHSVQDNGVACQLNNDNSVPWRLQTESRTTEVENGDDQKFGLGSNDFVNIGPTQCRWVPPQPPLVSMPEAAVAIRQPKSTPKDINLNVEETEQPVNGLDELLKTKNVSESFGQPELNEGENSGRQTCE
ncbi:Peroxisomal membrane protein PEX14 [Bienertia sinuspersici]